MKPYKKKIEDYKSLIRKQYVRENAIRELSAQCRDIMADQEGGGTSCFEFLYEQSKFIRKRWWVLQAGVLLLLWILLKDLNGAEGMERTMGIAAASFAILIIPEIWKNRRCLAMEIEGSCLYSLRQICAAKILLFAMADLTMITVFFVVTFHTVQVSVYEMAVNFMIPFNVSSGISFHLLCSRKNEMEYVAVLASGIFVVIWMAVVSQEILYGLIVESVWVFLLLLSFGYLVFCIRKSQVYCEIMWEKNVGGINI